MKFKHTICAMAALLALALPARAGNLDRVYGDSIAQGTGAALGWPTVAAQNLTSCQILNRLSGANYLHVVISAGINDPPGTCLEEIRQRIHAKYVMWILPADINSANAHVVAVAAKWGDRTVSYACSGTCTTSNFHPASYTSLANVILGLWGLD